MAKRAVVALDVGGTTVDAACISQARAVLGEVLESASPSAGTEDEILTELARAVGAALPDLPVIPAAGGNLALWGAAKYLLT
jgi:predicted NBD/HSP70 family sugar kinase